MVTVYLSDQWADKLLDEFESKGLPVELGEAWGNDILIEYTENGCTTRCAKLGEREMYLNLPRFFPPTMRIPQSEQPEFKEDKLFGIRGRLEAYMNGELEIPGISTSDDTAWLREAILLRRMLLPYIREELDAGTYSPEQEYSGIHFYKDGEKFLHKSVSGKERPALLWAKLNPETGELIEGPNRYYEDEFSNGAPMDALMAELENRPQFMADPSGSGAQIELPAIFLNAYQSGRLMLDGRRRRQELVVRMVKTEFRRKDSLWQHEFHNNAEHIYLSVDTLMKLPEEDIVMKKLPRDLLPEAVVELTDVELFGIVKLDGNNLSNTTLSLYRRIYINEMSPVLAEAANIRQGAVSFLGDGPVAAAGQGFLEDCALSLLYGYKKIIGALVAANWFEKHGPSKGKQVGTLIELDGEDIVIRRVAGKQRPDMVCGAKDEYFIDRPYKPDDDIDLPAAEERISLKKSDVSETETAEVNAEELERRAAEGDAKAMCLLAERCARLQDKRGALNWYKKVQTLHPEDDDIEFEIFMLELELNYE